MSQFYDVLKNGFFMRIDLGYRYDLDRVDYIFLKISIFIVDKERDSRFSLPSLVKFE